MLFFVYLKKTTLHDKFPHCPALSWYNIYGGNFAIFLIHSLPSKYWCGFFHCHILLFVTNKTWQNKLRAKLVVWLCYPFGPPANAVGCCYHAAPSLLQANTSCKQQTTAGKQGYQHRKKKQHNLQLVATLSG